MPESPYTADLPNGLSLEPGSTTSLPPSGPLGSGYTWSAAVEGDAVATTRAFIAKDIDEEGDSDARVHPAELRLEARPPRRP
jgi:hypothetical protein